MEIVDGCLPLEQPPPNVHFILIVLQQLEQRQLNVNYGDLVVFLMELHALQRQLAQHI